MKPQRLLGAVAILSVAFVVLTFCGIAHAAGTRDTPCSPTTPNNAICVLWTAPANDVGGMPIVQAITYRVEQKAGSSWTPVTTTSATKHYIQNLAPATYTFRVIAIVQAKESDPSNEASKAVEVLPPTAPVIQVVKVTISAEWVPVYTVLQGGQRSPTVGGMARVGTPCEGAVLFTYRRQEYRRPAQWERAYGVSATARVAAPCAVRTGNDG